MTLTPEQFETISNFLQAAQARIRANPRKLCVDPLFASAFVGQLQRWLTAQAPPRPPLEPPAPPARKWPGRGRPRKNEKRPGPVVEVEAEAAA
jgi:hypothetical protein